MTNTPHKWRDLKKKKYFWDQKIKTEIIIFLVIALHSIFVTICQPPLNSLLTRPLPLHITTSKIFLLGFLLTMEDGLGQSPTSTIRRRNSITTPVQIPTKLTLLTPKPLQTASSLSNGSAAAPLPLDLELISLKASYTSLKDILPSPVVAVNSPTASGPATNSGYEISIRNRLVKQAAWAYLQPMSASPDSSGPHFFSRFWLRLSSQNPFSSCLRFIHVKLLPGLTRIFDRIIRSIRIIFTR